MNNILRNQVKILRSKGATYSEIMSQLNLKIPKSTLSYWCKEINLPIKYNKKVRALLNINLKKARKIALDKLKVKKNQYLNNLYLKNTNLSSLLDKKEVAKLILTILYLCEGTKKQRASLTFGNSDPSIIKMFLILLKKVYIIDISKFRCTVQCRADQNINKLENYWAEITKIPKKQFYRARIDPRTIGKKSKNKDYKGVCRIDYFSADIYNELAVIIKILGDIKV